MMILNVTLGSEDTSDGAVQENDVETPSTCGPEQVLVDPIDKVPADAEKTRVGLVIGSLRVICIVLEEVYVDTSVEIMVTSPGSTFMIKFFVIRSSPS